jgi:hypothetical protein
MLSCILFASALGHAILESPTSRTTGQMSFQGEGIKIANFPATPEQLAGCLDSTPGTPTNVQPGSALEVRWRITIPHRSDPGVRVAIQFPGEQMQILQDNLDVNVLRTSVTIPQTTSSSAILQWIWASQEDGGFYMACADLNIAGNAPQAPAPQQPAPAPQAPTPVEQPTTPSLPPVNIPQQEPLPPANPVPQPPQVPAPPVEPVPPPPAPAPQQTQAPVEQAPLPPSQVTNAPAPYLTQAPGSSVVVTVRKCRPQYQ